MDIARYARLSTHERIVAWLTFEQHRGLAENTLQAYARALEDFVEFCARQRIGITKVRQDTIGLYINDLRQRSLPPQTGQTVYTRAQGLSDSTIRQRLTAIRRLYDYLEEDGLIEKNPVHRGRYLHNNPRGGIRGLVPETQHFPWIPDTEEWQRIITSLQTHKLRHKLLFALSYDAALRREEVCSLRIDDFDFAHRLLTIRAEITKSRRARKVPYTEGTGQLLRFYLHERAQISRHPGALFLSESPRNYGQAISSSIWSKIVKQIAQQADVPQLTPHTLRHLRLTDLARVGVDIHDIATFAGHRNIETTMQYIHLSGTDLAERIEAHFAQFKDWRLKDLIHEG